MLIQIRFQIRFEWSLFYCILRKGSFFFFFFWGRRLIPVRSSLLISPLGDPHTWPCWDQQLIQTCQLWKECHHDISDVLSPDELRATVMKRRRCKTGNCWNKNDQEEQVEILLPLPWDWSNFVDHTSVIACCISKCSTEAFKFKATFSAYCFRKCSPKATDLFGEIRTPQSYQNQCKHSGKDSMQIINKVQT